MLEEIINVVFVIVVCLMAFTITIKLTKSESTESLPESESISEYYDLVKIESGVSETIYYDKNTKIMYCLITTDEYSGITPIYNADGTPKVYKENPND